MPPRPNTETLQALRASIARESLYQFVRQGWSAIEPAPLKDNWHIRVVCDHLQSHLEAAGPQNLLINVPPGTGKPCYDGSMVQTKRGYIPLAEVAVGDEVLTHQGRYRRVSAVHVQGVLPTLQVRTAAGRVLRLADDHPLLTARGWVRADQILLTDVLATVCSADDAGTQTMPLHEARLLGYLIGDGGISHGVVGFTNADPETLADFEQCVSLMGWSVSKARVRNTWIYRLRGGPRTSAAEGSLGPVQRWLEGHGLRHSNSYTKHVPRAVLEGNKAVAAEFLAAYWSCDGCIHDRRDLPRSGRPGQISQSVRIDAVTVSETLARGVQHLLNLLGLRFRVRRKERAFKTQRQGDTYVSWQVTAEDQDTAAAFMQRVGPLLRHEKRTRAQGVVRKDFDRSLSPDPVRDVSRAEPAACRCLTVEEDHSFTIEDTAVHNSLLTAVFAPAWVWLRRPEWRMVFASGTPSVVTRDSLRCRSLIKSDWYQGTFAPTWSISKDQDEKQHFSNTAGGFRMGVGAGGAVTGVRANWLLTDDANDAKEIHSKAHREAINDRWWAGAFHNRIADPTTSKRTVIGQRLHAEDLAGYLLRQEAGQWAHLCLRMELEKGDELNTTWLGWKDTRAVGETLFPSYFTAAYLEAERTALGPSGYVGQMQQRPSSQDGNRFKREWWRFYTPTGGPAGSRPIGCSDLPSERLPTKFDRLIGTWDLSFKGTDSSDYVAGFVIGVTGARRWVRECFCERAGFTGASEAIRRQWEQWRPHEILVEDKANGPAVLESLGASVPRLIPVDPRGGKESRAAAIEPIIAAGNVFLPEGADWVAALVDQFAAFPRGAHDDMVDAISQGLTHLEENSDVRRARALLGISK